MKTETKEKALNINIVSLPIGDGVGNAMEYNAGCVLSARMRMFGAECVKCLFFHDDGKDTGQCRQRSPISGGFPVRLLNDWCGCFIKKEP